MKQTFIDKAGHYGDLRLYGNNPKAFQADNPLRIRAEPEAKILFGRVEISDCGMPLRQESGQVYFETLFCHDFTADLWNSTGNLKIKNLIVGFEPDEDWTYGDALHIDALGQFFSKDGSGVGNVDIENITAFISGENIQGMGLTEAERYYNFNVGWGEVKLEWLSNLPFAFDANTLEDSYINMGGAGVQIKKRKASLAKTENTRVVLATGENRNLEAGVEVIQEWKDYKSPTMEIAGGYLYVEDRRKLSAVDLAYWKARWSNFPPYEVDSDDYSIYKHVGTFDWLQSIRNEFGKPMKVTSAWRNTAHNKRVGGSSRSDHTYLWDRELNATAWDIAISDGAMGAKIEQLARNIGFNAIGRYQSRHFIHISKRAGRGTTWGKKWAT